MAVKVFCGVPAIHGYVGTPASGFSFSFPIHVSQSDGGENNGLRYFEDILIINCGLEDSPIDVFNQVYSLISEECTTVGYPIPTTSDIFCFAPVLLSMLLPPV